MLNSSSTAVSLANPLHIADNSAYWSVAGLTFTGPVVLENTGLNFYLGTDPQANNAAFTNSSVTFSGVISGSSTAAGINLGSGSGAGGLTLSSTQSTYGGPTSISYGTLIAGNSVYSGASGPFGNATSVITIGDANSGGNAAILALAGPSSLDYGLFFDRPITVNATAGPTTLEDTAAGDATLPNALAGSGAVIGSAITLSGTQSVTLSAANGGSVTFSGTNHTGGFGTISGGGALTLPRRATEM